MNSRANAPFWRHDAYVLGCLAKAIKQCVARVRAKGGLMAGTIVVDLGCGDAPYKNLLTEFGAQYVGCDIQPGAAVDKIIERGVVSLASASARCVTSFQVLEHVWDLDSYLGECHRLLDDEGLLILSTHGCWLYHPHPTDFRRWTRDGLLKELTSRGFSILEVWPVVGPLAWTTQFRTLAYHHVFSRLGPVGKILSGVVCAMMFARMWLEDRITPHPLIQDNAAVYLVLARRG